MATTETAGPPSTTVYRSPLPRGSAGFGRLLHAEWTKFRTVRRWSLTLLGAVAATVLVAVLSAQGNSTSGGEWDYSSGPDGTSVRDRFRFVHQQLTGDGTVTVRVTGLVAAAAGDRDQQSHGPASPWAKAGLIAKTSTTPGSGYAAVMLTPGHGVRFQYDFVHDAKGTAATTDVPRWLRLVRTGDVLTGYESADGVRWEKVGSGRPAGLGQTIEVGMFTTSPAVISTERSFGGTGVRGESAAATATFDGFTLEGTATGQLRGDTVKITPPPGAGMPPAPGIDASSETNGVFTLTGEGDIAPNEPDIDLARQALSGTAIGLIVFASLGILFITSEFRRGMIRTTFTASPHRGRVLAAKAVVLGAVTFVAGTVASILAFRLGYGALRDNGFRSPSFTELSLTDGVVLRALAGTGLVLALVVVLALSLGALLRSTAVGIAIVVVVMLLPQILVSGLPIGAARLLTQATPLAGLSIQTTREDFAQVDGTCLPEEGCYTYSPYTGVGVLLAYTAVLFGLAVWQLRRRSA